jgi:hypothetical protein
MTQVKPKGWYYQIVPGTVVGVSPTIEIRAHSDNHLVARIICPSTRAMGEVLAEAELMAAAPDLRRHLAAVVKKAEVAPQLLSETTPDFDAVVILAGDYLDDLNANLDYLPRADA